MDAVLSKVSRIPTYEVISPSSVAKKFGLHPSQILKMDANENLVFPLEFQKKILYEIIREEDLRYYPTDQLNNLHESLSQFLRVSKDNVIVGNGSDQLILAIGLIFLERETNIITLNPSFFTYKLSAFLNEAKVKVVNLSSKDFSLNLHDVFNVLDEKSRIFFICSPNNPTGNQFNQKLILDIAEEFEGIIVVDEAYVDFAEGSLVKEAVDQDNIIVLRSFSKSAGMAGFRLGYAVSCEENISALKKAFPPYHVNTLSLRAGLKIIQNYRIVKKVVEEVKRNRENLASELKEIGGIRVFDSKTNFILFRTNINSEEIYNSLLKKGIMVRIFRGNSLLRNCVRVTVGTEEMNKRFVESLKEILPWT